MFRWHLKQHPPPAEPRAVFGLNVHCQEKQLFRKTWHLTSESRNTTASRAVKIEGSRMMFIWIQDKKCLNLILKIMNFRKFRVRIEYISTHTHTHIHCDLCQPLRQCDWVGNNSCHSNSVVGLWAYACSGGVVGARWGSKHRNNECAQ